ncbi:pentapeptide repeat-containing protein [Microcoleus sp. C2C6]
MKIAVLPEEAQSQKLEIINDCNSLDINNEVGREMLTQILNRQVTVIDKDTKQIKAIVILRGEINSDINLKSLEAILRIYSGDTVKIIDIKEGSIKLFVKGSQEDIDRLVSLIKSGELKEVSGFPVEDVQILSESSEDDESNEINNKWHLVKKIAIQAFRHLLSKSSEDDESNELNNKWHLVREIVTQEIRDRNLRGVDLSDADLSDADLIDADLSGADLSGADLCGADLSGAYLIRADLSGADLSGADLNSAYLIRADLSGAYLSGAYLIRADLSGADLSGADLIDANLNSANLSGSDLSGANLRSADLRSADLSGANLSKTKVEKARFSSHSGISESMKQDLIKQGAIFEDSPGDRSEVLTKV